MFPIDNRNEASGIIIQGYDVLQLYRLVGYVDESLDEFKERRLIRSDGQTGTGWGLWGGGGGGGKRGG